MSKRVCALSIAGFDPSGGAGVLADVKTFEQIGVYGFSACTAITYQSDRTFKGIEWVSPEGILEQIAPLTADFEIKSVKIGLIESLETILAVVQELPTVPIIWDPILKTSTGHKFDGRDNPDLLREVCSKISLATPNTEEQSQLELSAEHCDIIVTGSGKADVLYSDGNKVELPVEAATGGEKHGSGCVFSAAIAAHIANGKSVLEACKLAQDYARSFLNSNDSLLGYHANGV